MDAMTENGIRQEQVESFGRLMAGLAHDMTNNLGIIRESNGLRDDILAMGIMSEDAKMMERLQKSITAIERRVVILVGMMHHLSSLAHRSDTPYSSFMINDLIEEEYTFLERFSRLRQINVGFEFGAALPSVYNDPALFQHIFYRMYSLCLEQVKSDNQFEIITEPENKDVKITFRLTENSKTSLEPFPDTTLLAAIEKMKGTLKAGENSDIVLRIPSLSV